MDKKIRFYITLLVISIVLILCGSVLTALTLTLPFFKATNATLMEICLFGGIALAIVGIVCLPIFAVVVHKQIAKRKHAVEQMADVEAQLDGSTTYNGVAVQYLPNQQAYDVANAAEYQTMDDKFEQIAKMDKAQFVIYVARLFSRKGYQVQLTPVVDNHDVDMIVEKMGVTIAVGCLLTDKIVGKQDVAKIFAGKEFYNVKNAMALTNMYFDRSALEYAKINHISLVDRNILANNYMK